MANRKRAMNTEQSSHKVIEKRRRDRINNCLAELSQVIPPAFSKQTSGKLEKAEILEMTVDYLRAIRATEIGVRYENGEWFSSDIWADFIHHHQIGYNECLREIVCFFSSVDGLSLSDTRYKRMITYLQSRFRPESSISNGLNGIVYRDTLQRVASKTNEQNSSSTEQSAFKCVQCDVRPRNAPVLSDITFPVASAGLRKENLYLSPTQSLWNTLPLHGVRNVKDRCCSIHIEK